MGEPNENKPSAQSPELWSKPTPDHQCFETQSEYFSVLMVRPQTMAMLTYNLVSYSGGFEGKQQ